MFVCLVVESLEGDRFSEIISTVQPSFVCNRPTQESQKVNDQGRRGAITNNVGALRIRHNPLEVGFVPAADHTRLPHKDLRRDVEAPERHRDRAHSHHVEVGSYPQEVDHDRGA